MAEDAPVALDLALAQVRRSDPIDSPGGTETMKETTDAAATSNVPSETTETQPQHPDSSSSSDDTDPGMETPPRSNGTETVPEQATKTEEASPSTNGSESIGVDSKDAAIPDEKEAPPTAAPAEPAPEPLTTSVDPDGGAAPVPATATAASLKDDPSEETIHVEENDDTPALADSTVTPVETTPVETTATPAPATPAITESTTPAAPTPNDTLSSSPTEDLSQNQNSQEERNSQAAIALAAVAVAANATHTSPAAAAEAARALVPGIVPEVVSMLHNRTIQHVSMAAVKQHLFDSESLIAQVMARGENDGLLQYLLLLCYFQVIEKDAAPGTPRSLSFDDDAAANNNSAEPNDAPLPVVDHELAAVAAEKVRSLLVVVEDAYDSIVDLLPQPPEVSSSSVDNFDGLEAPFFVPDLLPPCSSSPEDATIGFFLACSGAPHLPTTTADKKKEEEQDGISSLVPATTTKPADGESDSKDATTVGPQESSSSGAPATSVFSSLFSSGRRGSKGVVHSGSSSSTTAAPKSPPSTRGSFVGVFRKRNRRNSREHSDRSLKNTNSQDEDLLDGEYSVVIDREMLGLTVENVLERTVVRTVLPGGAAKKAGAKVGSLIVKVANVETKNLTHFETIDELRQSNRPLRLVMRQISSDGLRMAREEMGRLIRGGGFGTLLDGVVPEEAENQNGGGKQSVPAADGRPSRAEAFWQVLRARCSQAEAEIENKKESSLFHASEKLIWILTHLVIGLEREAAKLANESKLNESPQQRHAHYRHSAKDFTDAARSVSKILHDFLNWRLAPPKAEATVNAGNTGLNNYPTRKGKRGNPPPPPPGALGVPGKAKAMNVHSSLFRIGDVLHRTMSFLADPTSPPAAMLRSEVIAFLCDILDIDTGMELAEEESASSTAGGKAGPINDLGSAGSLLKLIILNCSMMRSAECVAASPPTYDCSALDLRRHSDAHTAGGLDLHRLHAGNRFLAVVHRLAASRSVSARVTACSLGPVLWSHLDFPHQLQLRGVITRALHDVDVSVRKSTATVLHEIAELVFDPRSVPWLVLMCERAMTDPEPQLRSAAMTLTWHLAEHLPNAFVGDASKGSRSVSRLPPRTDPTFAEVYLLQCKLLPVATRLAEDRAPSVRLAVAAQCDRLCGALGEHWFNIIIDVLQALLSDLDERVRGEAILCVPRLVEIVLVSSSQNGPPSGSVGVLQALLPVSIKLQRDPSASVRVGLATAAGELLTLLVGLETLDEISLQQTQSDSGSVGSDSASGFRQHKKHVDETLIPLLQQLLQDSDPEVTSSALRAVTNASRGNVRELRSRKYSVDVEDDMLSLSSFHSHHSHGSADKKDPVFIPVLSEKQVLRLIPTLSELADSKQWRVRQGAVEIVPALLGCTHKLETRSEIAQLCVRLMSDRVDAVRRTAAECLCLGGGALGSHGEEGSGGEWITAIVIPQLLLRSQDQDSRQRILSLKMIESILMNGMCPPRKPVVSGEGDDRIPKAPFDQLMEVVLSLSTDRVANVRLNVGRLLGDVMHVFEGDDIAFAMKILQDQIENEEQRDRGDRDVHFFAKRSVSIAQTRLEEEMSVSTENTTG